MTTSWRSKAVVARVDVGALAAVGEDVGAEFYAGRDIVTRKPARGWVERRICPRPHPLGPGTPSHNTERKALP